MKWSTIICKKVTAFDFDFDFIWFLDCFFSFHFHTYTSLGTKWCWANLSFPKKEPMGKGCVYKPSTCGSQTIKRTRSDSWMPVLKDHGTVITLNWVLSTKNQVRKPTLNCWFFASSFINTARFFEYFHKAKTIGFLALNFFSKVRTRGCDSENFQKSGTINPLISKIKINWNRRLLTKSKNCTTCAQISHIAS